MVPRSAPKRAAGKSALSAVGALGRVDDFQRSVWGEIAAAEHQIVQKLMPLINETAPRDVVDSLLKVQNQQLRLMGMLTGRCP